MTFDSDITLDLAWGDIEAKNVKLGNIPLFIHSNPKLRDVLPARVTSDRGKHQLAPCILPLNEEQAEVIGVPVGDGRTYSCANQARRELRKINWLLERAGQSSLTAANLKWGVSKPTPITLAPMVRQRTFSDLSPEECPF